MKKTQKFTVIDAVAAATTTLTPTAVASESCANLTIDDRVADLDVATPVKRRYRSASVTKALILEHIERTGKKPSTKSSDVSERQLAQAMGLYRCKKHSSFDEDFKAKTDAYAKSLKTRNTVQ